MSIVISLILKKLQTYKIFCFNCQSLFQRWITLNCFSNSTVNAILETNNYGNFVIQCNEFFSIFNNLHF